jgi:two-component system response regulator VanR
MENKMKLIENFSVKNGRLTKEDNEIKFTKTEKKIIELLEKNDNQLTTIEELETKVWYGKKFSVFTLRNAIAEIRKKTCYELIRNENGKGYIFNKENIQNS